MIISDDIRQSHPGVQNKEIPTASIQMSQMLYRKTMHFRKKTPRVNRLECISVGLLPAGAAGGLPGMWLKN